MRRPQDLLESYQVQVVLPVDQEVVDPGGHSVGDLVALGL